MSERIIWRDVALNIRPANIAQQRAAHFLLQESGNGLQHDHIFESHGTLPRICAICDELEEG